jgi:hydroxymethylpyrimidine/phosphomethylpyrimidine kinase
MADPELIPVEDRPAVLVVAGLDPSGGAGILTDAAVIRAFDLHPVTVLTAVAVQNTSRLGRRLDVPAPVLQEQLALLGEEFLLGAVKTGMLATTAAVETLAAWLAERPRLPLVLDPVLRSTSGGSLGEAGLLDAIKRVLLPRTRVATPNLEEAAALTGTAVADRDQVPDQARAIRELGPEWVLVKGGHLARGRASDYLAGPDVAVWLEEERSERTVRGTGCALASAVAAGLARGESVPDAARAAKSLVARGIEASYVAGQGRYLNLERRSRKE